MLVICEGRTRFRAFTGLQLELEEQLGTRVDLVRPKALKPRRPSHIDRDLILVARPRLFLQEILDSAAGPSQRAFKANGMAFHTELRNLEVSGEAAKRIPRDLRASAPRIAWWILCGSGDHLALAHFDLGMTPCGRW